MSAQSRLPAGASTGGQFATRARNEADVALTSSCKKEAAKIDGAEAATCHAARTHAATTAPAARMAGALEQTHDGHMDAQELATRRKALVEEALHPDREGVGHRFEVDDLADGVAHVIDPGASDIRRDALLQAARASIGAAVTGGHAWACTGEPGPLQHWTDEADTIVDTALDATWNASHNR